MQKSIGYSSETDNVIVSDKKQRIIIDFKDFEKLTDGIFKIRKKLMSIEKS